MPKTCCIFVFACQKGCDFFRVPLKDAFPL
jgi:hypothetical protein